MIYQFRPISKLFARIPQMHDCITVGLCVLGGRVYAVGGFNGSLRVRTVDIYDAAADQWSPCPEMEARRSTLGVAVLGNCVYAVRLRFSFFYIFYFVQIICKIRKFSIRKTLSLFLYCNCT